MHNKLVVTFEGDHVRVISDGEKDYEFQERVWTEIVSACKKHDCYRVLGIAHTTVPLEVLEGYDLARLFRELNITHKYKIAWIEHNEEARHLVDFVVTVLMNRGLPGQSFTNEAEAKKWLFEDRDVH